MTEQAIRTMSFILQDQLGLQVGQAHVTAQRLIHRLESAGYRITQTLTSEASNWEGK